jgi:putative sigma-54 modulation protein
MAIDKIEKQLKKHKERLKSHRPAHIHQAGPVRVRYEVFSAKDEEDGMQPEVLRSDEFLAKPMSVEEALMQMDLLNNDFLVFTRPERGDVHVIYRRKDGNFGLIAPGGESELATIAATRRHGRAHASK